MLLSGSEGLLNVWNNLQQALVACETGTHNSQANLSSWSMLIDHKISSYACTNLVQARSVYTFKCK